MNTNGGGPAIQVEDLSYSYGDRVAVDSVSFEVAPGEILGFLGSNGAGKSTTIKILTGQLAPRTGRATILGRDVHKESAESPTSVHLRSRPATSRRKIFCLFPDWPPWVTWILPTYWVIDAIFEVAINGAGLGDIWFELLIALAFCAVIGAGVMAAVQRMQRQLATG